MAFRFFLNKKPFDILIAFLIFAVSLMAVTILAVNLFGTKIDSPISTQPTGIVVADFNSDNKEDLAIASYGDDTVSVYFGNNDGTFASPVAYAVGSDPNRILSADFNGDSKPDLAVVNDSDANVSVLINNGNGTFAAAVNYVGQSSPSSIVAVNFGGDAKPDLAIVNGGSDSVSMLINNGNGTFAAAVNYSVGPSPSGVAAADFNNDTYQDMVVTSANNGTVAILINNGNGTFVAAVHYTASAPTDGIFEAVTGNFNSGTYPDIAVIAGSSTIAILLSNGDGTFASGVPYNVGSTPARINSVDLNDDSKPDIVVTNFSDSTVSVLLGNADGSFMDQDVYSTGSGPIGVSYGDFNQNGLIDLVVTNFSDNSFSLLPGSFPPPVIQSLSSTQKKVGDSPFLLTVYGTGFMSGASVNFSGVSKTTNFISSTELTTVVTALELLPAITYNVTVTNPDSQVSGSSTLEVSSPQVSGSGGGGGGAVDQGILNPFTTPKDQLEISINNGDLETSSRIIKLHLFGGEAVKLVSISSDPEFRDAGRLPYFNQIDWDLCSTNNNTVHTDTCQNGPHTLYARFYNSVGNSSETVSATINLNSTTESVTKDNADSIFEVIVPKQNQNNSGLLQMPEFPLNSLTLPLKFGMLGNDVLILQQFLALYQSIYPSGKTTGFYGALTRSAIALFQSRYKINQTGVLDESTRDALKSLWAR